MDSDPRVHSLITLGPQTVTIQRPCTDLLQQDTVNHVLQILQQKSEYFRTLSLKMTVEAQFHH